jgi:hypothetical protein
MLDQELSRGQKQRIKRKIYKLENPNAAEEKAAKISDEAGEGLKIRE